MSKIISLRIWGELEEWYNSLPEREKSAYIRQALRRGIKKNPDNIEVNAPDMKNVKVHQVEKKIVWRT